MLGRPDNFDTLAAARAALGGHVDLAVPAQIRRRERVRVAQQFFGRSLGDDLAAVNPGPRPEVDQIVGGPHRLLVVLDDDQRVAEVAQAEEGLQES